MQSHERIEDEQLGTQLGDGLGERIAVALDIESHGWRSDDVDVEVGQFASGGERDSVQSLSHDVQRVLGGEEQHAAGALDREAAQAGCAGCDRDSHVEREKRLAALRLAANDADRFVGPQVLDEPSAFDGPGREVGGACNRKQCRRRRAHRRDDFVRDAGAEALARPGRCSAFVISR